MKSEWEVKPITNIVGFNPKHTVKKGALVSYVEMAAVPEHSREIAYFDNREFKSGSKFQNGDTLFSRITPCLQNGKTCRVSQLAKDEIANGSTEFIVMSAKNSIDKDFVYYLALSKEFRKYAEGRMEGTTGRQRVSWQSLSEYELPMPPKEIRKKISYTLSTLDDKIELNRRMNQTLEEMAQALFKSWFVDFDPVHAKNNATNDADYEQIAKELGISRKVLDLFPDKFEESELGMIPKGWNLDRIGSVIIQKSENTKPSEYTQTHSYVPIDCIDSKCLALSTVKSGEEAKSSLIKFSRGDILFGAMRPYFHKVCIAPVDGTTRTTAFVLQSLKTDDYSFGVFSLYQDTTIKFATANSTGTTMPYVKWKGVLENMLIVLPSQTIRNEFNKICKPLLDTIQDRFAQQNTLQKTRDTLLPKLLSGELDVSELELDNVTH